MNGWVHIQVRQMGFRRISATVLLPWMICWLVVFPLMHVHPEADHAHGRTHHHHGGLVHSVLSQDLPCEFGPPDYPSSRRESHLSAMTLPNAGPHHTGNHIEITLSAMHQPPDKPTKKQMAEPGISPHIIQAPIPCLNPEISFTHQTSVYSSGVRTPYESRPPPTASL